MLQKIIEKALSQNKKVYIYAHKYPDGDAINSACALAEYFKTKKVDSVYVVSQPVQSPSTLCGKIFATKSVENNSISVILDTSTTEHCENTLFLSSSPEDIYVIDHHPKPDNGTLIEDDLNLPPENVIRDPSFSSTCEILSDKMVLQTPSPYIANMLTLGLLTDTGKLCHIQPNTFQNLLKLIKSGADYTMAIGLTSRKTSLMSEVGLSKIFLNTKKFPIGNTLGLIVPIDFETVQSSHTAFGLRSLQKRIFKLTNIKGCSFVCMFAENSPNQNDLEFRSSHIYGNFNVLQLASLYGGGGRDNASGCCIQRSNNR